SSSSNSRTASKNGSPSPTVAAMDLKVVDWSLGAQTRTHDPLKPNQAPATRDVEPGPEHRVGDDQQPPNGGPARTGAVAKRIPDPAASSDRGKLLLREQPGQPAGVVEDRAATRPSARWWRPRAPRRTGG